jgi:hypothetical protein
LADLVATVTYYRLGNVAACRIINRNRAVTLTEPTEFAELARPMSQPTWRTSSPLR